MTRQPSTKRWRLLALDKDGATIHDQVYVGDESLDVAMRGVEHDARTAKIRVEPR